jgi:hypothetical protein
MKFSGINYLYLDFTFSGWNRLKQQRPSLAWTWKGWGPLGGLPGDDAEDLHDGGDQGLFFLWEGLLVPLLDTPHFK